MATNKFEKYSSKVNPLYIPLPGFQFFHGSSSEEKVDDKYIGREGSIERLKSWLTSATDTGVYLVTGFRGMGKSSFVGKVLHEITESKKDKIAKIICLCMCILLLLLSAIVFLQNEIKCFQGEIKCFTPQITIYLAIGIPIIFLLFLLLKKRMGNKTKPHQRIPIKLNLGHEILNERDILSLVSNSIEYEYKKYLSNFNIHWRYTFFKWIFISAVTSLLSCITLAGFFKIPFEPNTETSIIAYFIKYLHDILAAIRTSESLIFNILVFIFTTTAIFFVVQSLWKLGKRVYIKFSANHPKIILEKLQDLNLRIVSATSEDANPYGAYSTSLFGLSINRRKNRNYPIADVREIEQRLSWILNEIAESKNAPKFIIVFDELDKVDPTSKSNTNDSTDTIPAFENSGSGFTRGATSRERKQNLMRLLANMKYFISTAKVKFVFIAGRELYDAFLADASDREFAVGSIFNGVIELKSFLDPDPAELREITAMTQRYICKLILPEPKALKKELPEIARKLERKFRKSKDGKPDEEWKKDVNYYIFTTYNMILGFRLEKAKEHLEKAKENLRDCKLKEVQENLAEAKKFLGKPVKTASDKTNLDEVEADYEKAEAIRKRTIIMLNQYAVYLSHFSNGAPKKITNLFEKYVWKKSGKEKEMKDEGYIDILGNVAPFKSDHYMIFTYKTQRKIGFIHHLFFPVINAVLNNASRYGDKLLISAGFLTNHLYKYHNNGFSWRNIESIPELMDINKSPETRKFIETVILFMQRSHLSATTINSLYHYKFPLRLAEEISIMSRLSTELSALLNFSLDDSLSLKMHYTELLNYYTARQNNVLTNGGNNNTVMVSAQNDFHHIIANIHHVLGDLHMFSEDYNEAIYEYQCGIDILTKKQPWNEIETWCKDPHTSLHILSVVRIMLKLGLAFEKRKTSNEAYLIYNEIVAMLKRIRSHKEKEKESDIMDAMFDDINLIYQALLARLFVLEKKGLSGIGTDDIDELENEFRDLSPKSKEKYMVKADFFRKLADILYYKNGLVNTDSNNLDMSLYLLDFRVDLRKALPYENNKDFYMVLKDGILQKNLTNCIEQAAKISSSTDHALEKKEKEEIEKLKEQKYIDDLQFKGNRSFKCIERRKNLLTGYWRTIEGRRMLIKDKRTPCYACKYYNRSLKEIMDNMIIRTGTNNPESKSIFFINQLRHKEKFKSLKEQDILTLAFALDGLGNVLLSCSMADSETGDKISDKFMKVFINLINNKDKYDNPNPKKCYKDLENLEESEEISSIGKSLLYLYAAAEYFKYSANMKEAFFCYKKILYVLVAYYKIHKIDEAKKNDYWEYWKQIKKYLVGRAIQNLYIQYENTNMVEIGMLKDMFIKGEYQHIPLNLLSAFPDLEEIIILCCRLELLWGLQGEEEEIGKGSLTARTYRSMSLSPYRMASTITERILALNFKASVNIRIFGQLLNLDNFKTDSYQPDFPIRFYEKFLDYLNNDINLGTYGSFIPEGKGIEKDDYKAKLELVEFLIIDTKFVLSKIIETISPTTQTTLFTESFMGGVYMQLYECNQVFDLIYLMYELFDEITDKEKDRTEEEKRINIKDVITRIWSFYVTRIENEQVKEVAGKLIKVIGEKYVSSERDREKIWSFYKDKINDLKANILITNLCGIFSITEEIPQKAKKLRRYLDDHTDYADYHNNITNYLHEMALRKYRRAIEMHHEGGAYQELLNSMYFLEDNLNNNTYQFHFAIERYNNNCGILNERVKRLKEISDTSSLLDADKYVKGASEWL
ncbi:MAG: ATP-binding protein [Bacteroidetes bacterium]|nr:ATP-binding protein [Bacteroidota bacterium]